MEISEDTEKLRHSAAHILAQAVLRLYPDAKLGIGPVTETGFSYDFAFTSPPNKSEAAFIQGIETEAERIIEEELPFTQTYLQKEEALDMLYQQGQIFKTELMQEITEGEISFYRTGSEFIDLCRGPHVSDSGKVGAIKIRQLSIAHWLGDASRPELLRITGLAFRTKKELQEYLALQDDILTRQHEVLGEELRIFGKTSNQADSIHTLLDNGVKMKAIILEKFSQEVIEDYPRIEFSNLWSEPLLNSNKFSQFVSEEEKVRLQGNFVLTRNSLPLELDYLELLSSKQQGNIEIETAINHKFSFLQQEINFDPNPSNLARSGLQIGLNHSVLRATELTAGKNLADSLKVLLLDLIGTYKQILPENYSMQVATNNTDISKFLADLLTNLGITVNISQDTTELLELSLSFRDIFELEHTLFTISVPLEPLELLNTQSNPKSTTQPSRKSKNFLPEICIIRSELIVSLEALISYLVEFYDGYLPMAIASSQVLILADNEAVLNYVDLVGKNFTNKGIRTEIYRSDFRQSLATNLREAKKLRAPFVLTATEHEEQNQIFTVIPAKGESLGLMNEQEFLQKVF